MSDCCNTTSCCPPPPTLVPGDIGLAGGNGANAINGIDAVATVTTGFVIPAIGSANAVTIAVSSSIPFVKGQIVVIGSWSGHAFTAGPITFQINAIPSVFSITVQRMGYTGDTVGTGTLFAGSLIASGETTIVPTLPLALKFGGSGAGDLASDATSKPLAQAQLGLGQNAVTSFQDFDAQTVNTYNAPRAQVGTVQVTIPATGTYLFLASVTMNFQGCKWSVTPPDIQPEIYNSTAAAMIVTATRRVAASGSTISMATVDYLLPYKMAAATLNNVIQLRICVTTDTDVPGGLKVVSGSLCAIPLRYS